MEPILIDNGKRPGEPYNAALGFWLPSDSLYGNLQLKLVKICQRLDEANRRIIDSFMFWEEACSQDLLASNSVERHVYANEQAVYLMRRAADEMVSLTWCLYCWERDGNYPAVIEVDCIGAILKGADDGALDYCQNYERVLTELNRVSNAFKHSFVNTDLNIIGRDEPCVYALLLERNRLEAGIEFHNISLSWLVRHFSEFYAAGIEWLQSFSERNR